MCLSCVLRSLFIQPCACQVSVPQCLGGGDARRNVRVCPAERLNTPCGRHNWVLAPSLPNPMLSCGAYLYSPVLVWCLAEHISTEFQFLSALEVSGECLAVLTHFQVNQLGGLCGKQFPSPRSLGRSLWCSASSAHRSRSAGLPVDPPSSSSACSALKSVSCRIPRCPAERLNTPCGRHN